MARGPLNEGEIKRYHEDGFVLVRGMFDRQAIEMLYASAKDDKPLDDHAQQGGRPGWRSPSLVVESSGRRHLRDVRALPVAGRFGGGAARRRGLSLPLHLAPVLRVMNKSKRRRQPRASLGLNQRDREVQVAAEKVDLLAIAALIASCAENAGAMGIDGSQRW